MHGHKLRTLLKQMSMAQLPHVSHLPRRIYTSLILYRPDITPSKGICTATP